MTYGNFLKRINVQLFLCLSFVLSAPLVAVLSSCGTEVGNGHSAPDGGDRGAAQNKVDTKTQVPADDPAAKVDPSESQSGGVQSDSSGNTAVPEELDFDQWEYNLLFSPCGSPFGDETLSTPISLGIKSDGAVSNIISLTRENSRWTNSDDVHVPFLSDIGQERFKINSLRLDEKTVLDSGYQCGVVSETPNTELTGYTAKFIKYSVVLTKNAQNVTLTWYVLQDANVEGTHRLNRIEIEKGTEKNTLENFSL